MKRLQRLRNSTAGLLGLSLVIGGYSLAPGPGLNGCAFGKSPPRVMAALDLPDYWNKNCIAIAEISSESGGDHIPIKIVARYSGPDTWLPPEVISLHDSFFMPQNDKPTFKVGDRLLIVQPVSSLASSPKGRPDALFVFKLEDKPAEDELTKTCKIIQQIRATTEIRRKLTLAAASANSVAGQFAQADILTMIHEKPAIIEQLSAMQSGGAADGRVGDLVKQILDAAKAAATQAGTHE